MLLLVLAVIVAAVLYILPESEAAAHEDKPDTSDAEPTTLEGALAAHLVRGEVSAATYRGTLARLAERDDERNPLSVPGDDRPDTCPDSRLPRR